MQPSDLPDRLVNACAPGCVVVSVMSGCVPGGAVLPPESTLQVDATLTPVVSSAEGLSGGPPRPVGAVLRPDGSRVEFVANEIILRVENQAELDAFIARYGATVLRDGTPLVIPGADQIAPPESSGYYLLQIDSDGHVVTVTITLNVGCIL